MRCEIVKVSLRFFLAVEERLDEICLRGRQRFRTHGHRLHVFLKRFSFLKSLLNGVVEYRLGRGSLVALLLVEAPRLVLSFACLGKGLHGLVGSVTFCC